MQTAVTINGVTAPDSHLTRSATALAKQSLPVPLLNHVYRTWWFAELLGRKRELHYDREVLYLASILHDLGLSPEHAGDARFEIDGADAAKRFLEANDYPAGKIALVWDAIALHSTNGIAERKQSEIALVYLGAHVDVMGLSLEEISSSIIDDILQLFPRDGFKKAFTQAVFEATKTKPHRAIGSGAADVLRRLGLDIPNVYDLIDAAPFAS